MKCIEDVPEEKVLVAVVSDRSTDCLCGTVSEEIHGSSWEIKDADARYQYRTTVSMVMFSIHLAAALYHLRGRFSTLLPDFIDVENLKHLLHF